jgi:nucleoside-diphosphate-sugar epimerase
MNRIVGTDLQPIHKAPREGDVRDSQADISKANALLGYRPLVQLEEGLKRTIDWCRAEASYAGRAT